MPLSSEHILAKGNFIGCSSPSVYGENCSNPCPAQCKHHRCHIETGHCFGCNDGYRGLRCEHRKKLCFKSIIQ